MLIIITACTCIAGASWYNTSYWSLAIWKQSMMKHTSFDIILRKSEIGFTAKKYSNVIVWSYQAECRWRWQCHQDRPQWGWILVWLKKLCDTYIIEVNHTQASINIRLQVCNKSHTVTSGVVWHGTLVRGRRDTNNSMRNPCNVQATLKKKSYTVEHLRITDKLAC